MTDGWIKLHRILKDKPIWKCSTPEQKTILITLLLMVNHDTNEWEWQGKKFKVVPGQMITSLDNIKKEAGQGITIQNIRTALLKFEKYEFLTNVSTKTGRLITIVNWGLYQSKEENQQSNQQSANKALTPNKNDKNEKNIFIDHFDTFWSAYPKKVGKAVAQKSFSKLKVDDRLLKLMLTAIDNQKQSKQWQDRQFIPNPTTWLNQRRWEDEEDERSTYNTGHQEIRIEDDGAIQL